MSPLPRRSFLSGLASLPFIGGGVTLIGQPTAAAVPVTMTLLDAYDEWLFMERRMLCIEKYGRGLDKVFGQAAPCNTLASGFHEHSGPDDWRVLASPMTRAAVVLSAVGVPIGGAA